MRAITSLIVLFTLLFVGGCGAFPASTAAPVETTPRPDMVTVTLEPTFPTQGIPQMTSENASLQDLIQKVKTDLSQRLSVSVDQINVGEVTEVEWSDSSLGCPQPGMSYLQVITPGYRLLLEAGGAQYEYHSSRDTYFVYCENPNPASP